MNDFALACRQKGNAGTLCADTAIGAKMQAENTASNTGELHQRTSQTSSGAPPQNTISKPGKTVSVGRGAVAQCTKSAVADRGNEADCDGGVSGEAAPPEGHI